MRKSVLFFSMAFITISFCGCWGNRYISADPDLEAVFMGKSYYQIVDEFGQPDATTHDDWGGTKAVYNCTSLNGTSAAGLYRKYDMRNRTTELKGTPASHVTFSFNINNKCYAVESDLERKKVREVKPKPEEPRDPKLPVKVKPRVPRVLDFPFFKSRSPFAEQVSIERIEVDRTQTTVYFSYCNRTPKHRPLYDKGLSINKDVFLRDCATGHRAKLIKTDGITLYPEYTPFAHYRGGYDMLVYSLTFESLPLETETIDIIEPGPEGFNFYNIDVRTPMNFREYKSAEPLPESTPLN